MARYIIAPLALSYPFRAGTKCARLEESSPLKKPGRETAQETGWSTDRVGAAAQP